MELNMKVLESERFRMLHGNVQLIYIYAALRAEKGVYKNVSEFDEYLFVGIDDIYDAIGILERYGLVHYWGEYDAMKIVHDPIVEFEPALQERGVIDEQDEDESI